MKSKVRLGSVRSTDLELRLGRSRDLISWPFRDIPNELYSTALTRLLRTSSDRWVWQNEINDSSIISRLLQIVIDLLLADTRQTQANNVLNVHRNHNLLIGGKGVWRWGKREITYLSLHCHHNDSFIKMCRDENHFTVSLIVRDKVTRQYPQTTTLSKSRKG